MKFLIVLLVLANIAIEAKSESLSPYMGQEKREIKALSQERISRLLEGKGLGYAKVAELNGFPGPAHVLKLGSALKLSDNQKTKTAALFQKMQAEAQSIGKDLIEAERQLDAMFITHGVSAEEIEKQISKISKLEGNLRAAHVIAHLEQKAILSKGQVQAYNKMRGYSEGNQKHHNHKHDH